MTRKASQLQPMDTSEVDLTPDEVSRFTRSFQDPQFKALFYDYLAEISDPATKKLYDDQLAHMDAKIITPAFELLIEINAVFINICSSSLIDPITSTRETINGVSGDSLRIPHSCGSVRTVDGAKVWDVVFFTDTVARARKDPRILHLLVDTCMEAVGVEGDWKVVKGGPKGTLVNTMIRDITSKSSNLAEKQSTLFKNTNSSNLAEKSTSFKNTNSSNVAEKQSPPFKNTKSSTLPPSSKKTSKPKSNSTPSPKKVPVEKKVTPPVQTIIEPSYKILHQTNHSDYQKFTNNPSLHPDALTLRIHLPLIPTADSIELDITPTTFHLEVKDIYRLDLILPLEVDKEGEAEFDVGTRTLSVKVKVVPKAVKKKVFKDIVVEEESEDLLNAVVEDEVDDKVKEEEKEEETVDLNKDPEEPRDTIIHSTESQKNHLAPKSLPEVVISKLASQLETKPSIVTETPDSSDVPQDEQPLSQRDANTLESRDALNEPITELTATLNSLQVDSDDESVDGLTAALSKSTIASIPKYKAHQDSESLTLILDYKTEPTITIDGAIVTMTGAYDIEFIFTGELKSYESSVSDLNVVVVLMKKEIGMWDSFTVKTAEETVTETFLRMNNVQDLDVEVKVQSD